MASPGLGAFADVDHSGPRLTPDMRGPEDRSGALRAPEHAGANMARRWLECQDAPDADMKQFTPAARMP
jgi:hypothetical protein